MDVGGGHFAGCVGRVGLGSVPKVAGSVLVLSSCIFVHRGGHSLLGGYLSKVLRVGMFWVVVSISATGYLVVWFLIWEWLLDHTGCTFGQGGLRLWLWPLDSGGLTVGPGWWHVCFEAGTCLKCALSEAHWVCFGADSPPSLSCLV